MVKIAFIWAEDEAGWIGKDNDMPWHLSADLKHFKHLTSGHPVIMGKNTYLSLGRPLPKRTNIVVTRQTTPIEGVTLVNGVNALTDLLANYGEDEEVFILGGAHLFASTMSLATVLYRTVVEGDHHGDVKMAPIDYRTWQKVAERHLQATESDPACTFEKWVLNVKQN